MKAKNFDRKFDSGGKILDQVDLSKARRVGTDAKRVNVDFPAWMVDSLDREARRLGVTRQSPIKLWLAKVGYERMQELSDPALALERARATWQKHGRSEKWIQQRMTGQETRNKLTDYWAAHEIKKGDEYAILTNLIH